MDGYQLLCEVTAIKKRKLSDEARKKLQDAGIIKPEAEYLKGIEKGTQNIIKKRNVPIHDTDRLHRLYASIQGGGAATMNIHGQDHVYINPKSRLLRNARDAAQVKRHELDEVAVSSKIKRQLGAPHQITQVRKNNKIVGRHASPRVVKREYERHKQLENLYGPNKKSKLTKFRNKSGEYESIRNMSTRQLRKLEKQSGVTVKQAKNYHPIFRPSAELGSQWTINTPKKSILKKPNLSKTKDKIVKSTSKLKNSTSKKLKQLKKFVKSIPK
jgi:hypothetical protein